ncbi:MAG: protein translocase subunit SecF [Dehalococcoidia bacterium]
MIDIVGKRGWYFIFSALLIIPGLISMIIPPGGWVTLGSGLNPGIDFTSGSVLDVTFEEPVTQQQIQVRMEALGHPETLIQKTGSRSVLIRTKQLAEATAGGTSERARIQDDLADNVAPIESVGFDSISPIVAQETVRNAFFALLAASVFILLYIWYAFRRVPKSYRYGISAVLTLVHDTLIVLGVFSILGRAINMEVNSMFIVGILTVAGYSVNDTIVVFDRIRENAIRFPDRALDSVVNLSIVETLGRSVNTSFTTFMVLLAMLLIGGPSIRELLLVVAIGVIIGTYSSICIASQFIVIWDRGEMGRVIGRGRRVPATAAAGLLHLIGR